MFETRVTKLFGIKYPIMSGVMVTAITGWIGSSRF